MSGGWSWSEGISDELWTEDRAKDSDAMAPNTVSSLTTPALTTKKSYRFYREEVALWQVITILTIIQVYKLLEDSRKTEIEKQRIIAGVKCNEDTTNLLRRVMASMKKVTVDEVEVEAGKGSGSVSCTMVLMAVVGDQ